MKSIAVALSTGMAWGVLLVLSNPEHLLLGVGAVIVAVAGTAISASLAD